VTAKGGLREQVRAAFSENLGLKLFALACSIALYAFNHGPENAQRTISVSVLSLMPPESANRQLITQLPTEVGVTVRGSRAQIDDVHTDDIGSLRLDLRSGRDQRIDLDPSMFHVPPGITVEQIIPSSIKVRWDDVVQKAIPVQVPRTGEPASGHLIKGAIAADPPEVHARGPRSIVDVMQFARTTPYDVSGLTEGSHPLKLPLDKPPTLVFYDVEQVQATVEIAREQVKKSFPKIKVEVIGAPRATARPQTVTILVTGTAEDVNGLLPEAIVPRVEPKSFGHDLGKPGKDILPVLVDLPKVKVEVEPPKVVVTW
jgi:YbbR domain-containing protein